MTNSALLYLTVVNLLNYLDRYLLAACLPLIVTEFSLTNEEGGRLFSAFVLGYLIFSPIFGILGDRMKRPMLMAIGVAIWSITTVATGFIGNYALLLLVRSFVGVGEASFATIAPSYIKDHVSDVTKLNNSLSIFYTAVPVGSALGYVFAGLIAHYFSWHAVFWFGGAPGLVLALGLLMFKEERAVSTKRSSIREGIKQIVSVPVLNYSILGYAAQTFGLTGIATFITKLGVEKGFTHDEISTAFGLILVATGFIGTLLGGRLASKLVANTDKKSRGLLGFNAISTLAAVPFLIIAFQTQSQSIFIAACTLAELLVFASTAPINSILVSEAPPNYVALTQGVTIATLNILGSLLGPILVGYLADKYSLPIGLQATSIAVAISGMIWWMGRQKC